MSDLLYVLLLALWGVIRLAVAVVRNILVGIAWTIRLVSEGTVLLRDDWKERRS